MFKYTVRYKLQSGRIIDSQTYAFDVNGVSVIAKSVMKTLPGCIGYQIFKGLVEMAYHAA